MTKFENQTAQSQSFAEKLTKADLEILKAPFGSDRLGVKVQSLSKDKTRALLVLYLQHTDVQDRLEEVDPAWTCEVLSEQAVGDTIYVRSRMTLKGVSRENVGEGGDPKSAYSDALKRCAMLFGVGRYLYDSPTVWSAYDESRDRFKQWSVEEYDAAMKPGDRREKPAAKPTQQAAGVNPGLTQSEGPAAPASVSPKIKAKSSKTTASASVTEAPADKGPGGSRPREELNRVLMNMYRPFLTQFPDTQFAPLLKSRYNVGETRLMTLEQLEDLVQFMQQKLQSVA